MTKLVSATLVNTSIPKGRTWMSQVSKLFLARLVVPERSWHSIFGICSRSKKSSGLECPHPECNLKTCVVSTAFKMWILLTSSAVQETTSLLYLVSGECCEDLQQVRLLQRFPLRATKIVLFFISTTEEQRQSCSNKNIKVWNFESVAVMPVFSTYPPQFWDKRWVFCTELYGSCLEGFRDRGKVGPALQLDERCWMNDRKGATPVPGPTIITGTLSSDGKRTVPFFTQIGTCSTTKRHAKYNSCKVFIWRAVFRPLYDTAAGFLHCIKMVPVKSHDDCSRIVFCCWTGTIFVWWQPISYHEASTHDR